MLFQLFYNSVQKFPQQPALWVDGELYSYADLYNSSQQIANALMPIANERVGLFASRSISAYSGVLGILQSGKTYVPLNPKFPESRNAAIAKLAGVNTIIVGKECLHAIAEITQLLDDHIQLLFPDCTESEIPAIVLQSHTCFFVADSSQNATINPTPSHLAYILFTSGSTGLPKGVPIKQQSVLDYVDYLYQRYLPNENDKFSQTFDLTFDLSVHDMFLCWKSGACLYSLPEKTVLGPGKFIKEHQLSFWFSVPSVAQFMDSFRMLKPDIFHSLRVSLFCGEPLPVNVAMKWQQATGNQRLENIYGPTEATIGISHYTLPNIAENIKSKNGIVSIGSVFSSQNYKIKTDTSLPENTGELLLSGSQITDGYWHNDVKTNENFETDNLGVLWYKTGDIVELDKDGDLFYLERKDFQVKIRGYRIELEEINHAISKFSGESMVYSIPWPIKDGIAESIYTFVGVNCKNSKAELIQHLQTILPEYMVPKDIAFVANFPLNSNGKIDKLALINTLEK